MKNGNIIIPIFLFIFIGVLSALFSLKIVVSDSMEPTLFEGDVVLVTKLFRPKQGHIYGFFHENTLFIKRALTVSPSVVEIRKGDLYIDHVFYSPSFKTYRAFENTGVFKNPGKHIFFLGDNRIDSYDSRHFGPICYSNVRYRVLLVIFPVKRLGAVK